MDWYVQFRDFMGPKRPAKFSTEERAEKQIVRLLEYLIGLYKHHFKTMRFVSKHATQPLPPEQDQYYKAAQKMVAQVERLLYKGAVWEADAVWRRFVDDTPWHFFSTGDYRVWTDATERTEWPGDFGMGAQYVRASRFAHYRQPVTDVFTEAALKEGEPGDIHTVAALLRDKYGRAADVEIFEHEGDLKSARIEAKRLAQKRLSKRQKDTDATIDYFLMGLQIRERRSDILIREMDNFQLPAETLAEILEVVREHPAYVGQGFLIFDQDGIPVTMEGGEIKIQEGAS
jgi:hypothetical protein